MTIISNPNVIAQIAAAVASNEHLKQAVENPAKRGELPWMIAITSGQQFQPAEIAAYIEQLPAREQPAPADRFARIPDYMKARRQWVLWRKEVQDKEPFRPNGVHAATDNPATWISFEEALAAYAAGRFEGLGYVLSKDDGLQCIDLDGCLIDGKPMPWAREVLDQYPRDYAEVSARGSGLHIIAFNDMVAEHSERQAKLSNALGPMKHPSGKQCMIELFDGNSPRFIAMTGDIFEGRNTLGQAPDTALPWFAEKYGLGRENLAKARTAESGHEEVIDDSEAVQARAKEYLSRVEAVNGDRNNTIYRAVGVLKDEGLSEDVTQALIADYLLSKPAFTDFSQAEAEKAVASAYRNGQNVQGAKHPLNAFAAFSRILGFTEQKKQAWTEAAKQVQTRGFILDGDGVWKVGTKEKGEVKTYISDAAYVVAETSGAASCLIVECVCRDKRFIEVVVELHLLHERGGGSLAELFARQGFNIEPGMANDFAKYLSRNRDAVRLKAVSRTGWLLPADQNQSPIFVFPDATTTAEGYRFTGSSKLADAMKPAGSLAEWIVSVWDVAGENSYARYEVFKALSAPLYRFCLAAEAMGENIYGLSSKGKTTLLQVQSSVWGRAVPPSKGGTSPSFILTWNATDNALLTQVEQYNDLPCCIDEIGTSTSTNFATLIYSLFSGRERARLNANADQKEQRAWQTVITSSGEVSIRTLIESKSQSSSNNKTLAKAGTIIRFTDRKIQQAPFDCRETVDALKEACGRYYGTLGRAFIARLASYSTTALNGLIESQFSKALHRITAQYPNADGMQVRAMHRFAMSEVGGKLLCDFGLIPSLTAELVEQAIDHVVAEWEPSSRQLNDIERGLVALREYAIANLQHRFGTVTEIKGGQGRDLTERIYRERDGVYDQAEGVLYVFGPALKNITGLEASELATELDRQGWLVREKGNRLQKRKRIYGMQLSAYAIKNDFLMADPDPEESEGNG